MDKNIRRFRPDNSLLKKALLKANDNGFDFNMRQLVNYLIAQVNSGVIPLVIDGCTFTYGDYTTFSYEPAAMASLKKQIVDKGFAPVNDFVVNLLFHLYINNQK